LQNKHKETIGDHIRSLQNGEEKGFNFFFREYYAALTYYSFSITKDRSVAEEIAGEALLKLWERHAKFDNASAIKSFLYTTTHNTSLNWLRQQKKNTQRLKEMKYLFDESESNKFQKIVETETYREIFAAIDKLPPQCRKIFQMLFFEGKDYKHISKELNLSINTVRNQKARALLILRQYISLSIFILSLAVLL
jgi:RNA polymerase sigma-70 factor (family 1)